MKKLFVISGSSGVGKGTIIKKFLEKNNNFKLSVSCTTRKPREGEINGVNYHFLSQDEFKNAIENNEFLEWANFSENYYGTRKSIVENALKNDEDLLLEIDTQGALQVIQKMPEAVLIFIAPPSLEVLESRLRNRNTESEETIQKRLKFVEMEMENATKFHYTLINDNLDVAVKELENIIKNEQN